ncbi:MAG: flagellar basal body L-ring protein FlgH [Comamonadaceae bacterium]
MNTRSAVCERTGRVLAAVVLLAGCAQNPREPLVQQPMSVRPTAQLQATSSVPAHGAIYRTGAGAQALFEDRRPCSVGDTLTILVSENVNASKNSAANVSRTGSASAELALVPKVFGGLMSGTLDSSGSGKNNLSSKGGANATNTFNGIITVTIVEVLPNGNLQVSGEKQMLINQGTEYIRFSGVVNPRAVSSNNTVASTQVADARIEYSAKGYIDEAQQMGWLQRFFLNVMPM